ncbi:MAG: DAK2 domain-containing protein [Clostridiales bacterium]|nr:DAK2 domain-containing protein [Clostridiales bacterium]
MIYEGQQKKIDGILFEKLIKSGAMNLKAHLKTVNELNVFPIPDGDTGDNMFMTFNGGLNSMKKCTENSVWKKAQALAEGMLLNARGNSGVILSQLFAGISDGVRDKETITVQEFGIAMGEGVKRAYLAVAQPVEGTMLTVARESAEFAVNISDGYILADFLKDFVKAVTQSLNRTPELLPVLKEAGVIDSGGAGLLYIAEGMESLAEGKEIADSDGVEFEAEENKSVSFDSFNENSEMKYGYCTEMLVQLLSAKTDVNNFSVPDLITFLESIGDSVVAFQTGTIIKLHVHTMVPYKVLEHCHQFGEFLTVKIENMTVQHNEVRNEEDRFKVQKARKKFAVVTVVNGKGLVETFTELGADEIIIGGQGNNPSTDRFLKAFDNVNADYVFVLPNNGNIVMTAKQAGEMYKKSDVRVIETKDIGQAYSVMSMLDFESDSADEIEAQMNEAKNDVITGMVTSSVREANLNGVKIAQGEYIGFSDKTIYVSEKEKIKAFLGLAEKLSVSEKSFMIVSFGSSVTLGEKEDLQREINTRYPHIEYYAIDGGQEIYDFIMILE